MSDDKLYELPKHDKNFINLLSVLFIGLKLGDVIDWSWWWVLSPFWIAAVVVILINVLKKLAA